MLRLAHRRRAGRVRHPQVGRPGVEVDQEALGGRADGDRAGPLEVVLLIRQRLGAGGALLDGGARLELADLPALGERTGVALQVAQVALVFAARYPCQRLARRTDDEQMKRRNV